jgi:hypothetical protein
MHYQNRQHAKIEEKQMFACKEYFQNRSGRHTNEFLSSLKIERAGNGKGKYIYKIKQYFVFSQAIMIYICR